MIADHESGSAIRTSRVNLMSYTSEHHSPRTRAREIAGENTHNLARQDCAQTTHAPAHVHGNAIRPLKCKDLAMSVIEIFVRRDKPA